MRVPCYCAYLTTLLAPVYVGGRISLQLACAWNGAVHAVSYRNAAHAAVCLCVLTLTFQDPYVPPRI